MKKLATALLFATLSASSFAADISDYGDNQHHYSPSVEACRAKSFWMDRDDCLKAEQAKLPKISKKSQRDCNALAKQSTAGSGSSVGTWTLLCQIDAAQKLSSPSPSQQTRQ